jgi:2'-5' RNA ligase
MARTVIASLAEARAALEAARSSGAAAELESPPGAAGIYGVLWFAELNRALLAEFPQTPFTLTLDCGERADLAHAALVEGIKRIRFRGHPEAAKALGDIARQLDAKLVAAGLLYVIAEPDLSPEDRAWIQSIRKQHDPQFNLVGPHFTLVFGTDAMPADALAAHVKRIAGRAATFAFVLRRIEVFDDCYLFLVPETGARELISLHDALRLAPASGAGFVPHMTVGRIAGAPAAQAIARELNASGQLIRGHVSALKIIAVEGHLAREIATLDLEGR